MTDPVDVDELNTNLLDPLQPRPIDRPTVLPSGGVIDPEVGDIAKIFAAPDDPGARAGWRADLRAWRTAARARLGYRGAAYDDPRTEWTQGAYAVALVWLWDERLFDHDAQRFTPERLLASFDGSGGLDGIVLWHAYPVIGIDDRNQFDYYRSVPGIRELIAQLRGHGLRVFVNYNPWDVGTRRPDHDDAGELAILVRELAVDGVFLDTLKEADHALVETLRSTDPPQALEGESRVPLERIEDHQLSWAQWFADSAVPGVLRAHWYERRHMMHSTRRWNRDHSDELQTGWLNGTGVLLWDAVFGVWVGWNARDRATLARMLPIQRRLRELLVNGDWEPLTDLDPAAESAGVYASRYSSDGVALWTVVNRGVEDYLGPVVPSVEAMTAVPARGVAAIFKVADDADAGLAAAARDAREEYEAVLAVSDATFPHRDAVRTVPAPSTRPGPAAAIALQAGPRALTVTFRRRETALYGEAPYIEEWKPLPPRLHDERSRVFEVHVGDVTVATREVSAAEYALFLARNDRERAEEPVDSEEPATRITLAEARAYAEWVGARLPTEFEWQCAAEDPRFERRSPAVWNWTESEHSDGITRFVILKGGSDFVATGSDWYFDGGSRAPEFSAKYLLLGLGLDASPNIGFRLAWDRGTGPAT